MTFTVIHPLQAFQMLQLQHFEWYSSGPSATDETVVECWAWNAWSQAFQIRYADLNCLYVDGFLSGGGV